MNQQYYDVDGGYGKMESNYRWWEFYLVRYFVGTVVGTLIVLFLVLNQESEVHKIVLHNSTFGSKGTIPWEPVHLWAYAFIGLAFCYISSGPILFLHAVRGMIFKFKDGNKGVYEYYSTLGVYRARRKPKDEPDAVREYVESYKHLREHGNAFFIVLFELIFGLILFYAKPLWMILSLSVWVMLAASVWWIGTYLESKLKHHVQRRRR